MTNTYIGMVLSIIGMLITAFSFQVKKKNNLLILQTVGSAFYLLSYFFAAAGIAVFLNILFLVRNFLFMKIDAGKEPKKARLACITLCILYLCGYIGYFLFADGTLSARIWNIVPIIGSVFGTVALTNTDVNRIRLWKCGDALSWVSFNAHIGLAALGGIIGDSLNLFSCILGMIRFRKDIK